MHSRRRRWWVVPCIVLAFLMAVPAAVDAQSSVAEGSRAQGGRMPVGAEITAALERAKADPNLGSERTIRTLRWKGDDAPASVTRPGWLEWVRAFFEWLARSTRLLIWIAAVVAAVALAWYLVRVLNAGATTQVEDEFVTPTHVHQLDIRPTSLPADIGAAARALWLRGEHRAALSLLYRGLLSRLAHVHAVPIRESSTEGECLLLAERLLTPPAHAYAARLVDVWQRAVYGRQDANDETVDALCAAFSGALDRRLVRQTPEGHA